MRLPFIMLVVASHVNYGAAMQELLVDMETMNVDLKQVVIVIAGAQGMSIQQNQSGVITITIPYNFYELTAVYGIFAYLHHPLLANCDHFLFMARFLSEMKDGGIDVYYASADRKCNIAGLSRRFVQTCGAGYGRDGDKGLAWQAEHNGDFSFVKEATKKDMKVENYPAETFWVPGLFSYPGSPIKRCMVYFGALDMFKFVATCDETINPPWQDRKSP